MNVTPKHTDLTKLSDDLLEGLRVNYLLSQSEHENGNTPQHIFLYIVACGWLDAIEAEWQRRLKTRNPHTAQNEGTSS